MTNAWTLQPCTTLLAAEDITPEILDLAREILDTWEFDRNGRGTPIPEETLIERIEHTQLEDGTYPDFGEDLTTPAASEILRLAYES